MATSVGATGTSAPATLNLGISGINTGLDTNSIVQKLVSLRQQTTNIIASKQQVSQQKLTTFQNLQSQLQTFSSVATTLNTQDQFLSTQASFSNNNATAQNTVMNVTTSGLATSGTYSLVVNSLAKATQLVSQGFSDINTHINDGTFQITVGNTVTNITINSTNDTLEGLRSAINNSGAAVTASYVNDGSANPIRLVIAGTQTGAANSVTAQLQVSNFGAGTANLMPFTQTQAAQDATMVVNGISVTKSSNTVTDVINGATLNLQSIGSGALTISTNTSAITTKINSFISGYNTVMTYLNQLLAVNPDKTTGVLFGNAAVEDIQNQLRNAVTTPIAGVSGPYSFLSQVGITTQADGTLSLDTGALNTALTTNLRNVSQLFASTGSTSNTGVAYIGMTNNTQGGIYDLRVSGGVPQLSPTGQNNFANAVGSGNFYSGATGTLAEGLNFRITSTTDGSYGTITQTVGVADQINRVLTNETDLSLNGPLATEISTAQQTIADDQASIDAQNAQLATYQQSLLAQFANMEVIVGNLKSQASAFSSALAGVQATAPSSSTTTTPTPTVPTPTSSSSTTSTTGA